MYMVRVQVLKATSMKMSSGMCTVSLVEFTDVSEMLTDSHVTLTSCSRQVIKLLGHEALLGLCAGCGVVTAVKMLVLWSFGFEAV
jgi:hypothetical protein